MTFQLFTSNVKIGVLQKYSLCSIPTKFKFDKLCIMLYMYVQNVG